VKKGGVRKRLKSVGSKLRIGTESGRGKLSKLTSKN